MRTTIVTCKGAKSQQVYFLSLRFSNQIGVDPWKTKAGKRMAENPNQKQGRNLKLVDKKPK